MGSVSFNITGELADRVDSVNEILVDEDGAAGFSLEFAIQVIHGRGHCHKDFADRVVRRFHSKRRL